MCNSLKHWFKHPLPYMDRANLYHKPCHLYVRVVWANKLIYWAPSILYVQFLQTPPSLELRCLILLDWKFIICTCGEEKTKYTHV